MEENKVEGKCCENGSCPKCKMGHACGHKCCHGIVKLLIMLILLACAFYAGIMFRSDRELPIRVYKDVMINNDSIPQENNLKSTASGSTTVQVMPEEQDKNTPPVLE